MATIITDLIDQYDNGNIALEDDWADAGGAGATNDVQTSVKAHGTKAIILQGGRNIVGTGDAQTDGRQTYYVRFAQTNITYTHSTGEGGIGPGDLMSQVIFKNDGKVYYNDGSEVELSASYIADTWYAIQVDWRSVDHLVRYNFNEEGWTGWVSPKNTWTTGPDRIYITASSGGTAYLDTFKEELFNPVAIDVADTLGLSESISLFKNSVLTVSDALGLTEAITMTKGVFLTVSDALGISDNLKRIIHKIGKLAVSYTKQGKQTSSYTKQEKPND